MRCLDDISKMIPEGTYLEMCDNLRALHNDKSHGSPTDRRSVPFMPVMHDLEDIPVVENDYDRWAENEAAIIYMEEQIKEEGKQLKKLRSGKNITEVVKRDAVRKCAGATRFRVEKQ